MEGHITIRMRAALFILQEKITQAHREGMKVEEWRANLPSFNFYEDSPPCPSPMIIAIAQTLPIYLFARVANEKKEQGIMSRVKEGDVDIPYEWKPAP